MKRNIRLIGAFNFFTDLKFHSAVLVLYFSHVTGSFALAMSLFSIVMVSSALFEIPTGIYSDKIGRKGTIVWGACCASLSAFLYAVGGNYWILALGALMEGISRSWYSGNNDALLYESVRDLKDKSAYEEFMGKTHALFQAALMIGAVVGSIIATWSYPVIMWMSVIPQFVCIALAARMVEPPRAQKKSGNIFGHLRESFLNIGSNKRLQLLTTYNVIHYATGEAGFDFASAFMATLWPTWAIGIAKTISFLGGMASFWYSGKMIRKFSAGTLLLIKDIYNTVLVMTALYFPTVASPVIYSSTSLFYGVSSVAQSSLLQNEFTSEQRATLQSITSLFGSLLYGIVSVALGYIADLTSPRTALIYNRWIAVPFIAISAWLAFSHSRKTQTAPAVA